MPQTILVEQDSEQGATVILTPPAVSDACDSALDVSDDAPAIFPPGETTVTYVARDGAGNVAQGTLTVVVQDTLAPVIAAATATPSILWPPNGRLVEVHLEIVAFDVADASPSCRVASVSTSDGVSLASPAAAGDWHAVSDDTLLLRAARLGYAGSRTYHVEVACQDDSGNVATTQVAVLVPHDRR